MSKGRGGDGTNKRSARVAAVVANQNVSNTLKESSQISNSRKTGSNLHSTEAELLTNKAAETFPPLEHAHMDFAKLPKYQLIEYVKQNNLMSDNNSALHQMDVDVLANIAKSHFYSTEIDEKEAIVWFLYRNHHSSKELKLPMHNMGNFGLKSPMNIDTLSETNSTVV